MPKTRIIKIPPLTETKPKTIEQVLEQIETRHYRGCDHEQELASEIIGEVQKALRELGLADVVKPEEEGARCHFCGSKEYQLVHRHYCIEKTP